MAGQPDSGRADRIVSSSHLADGELAKLSELEYGLIVAFNAFQRWITRCMAASGNHDLSAIEILVLHNVYHRNRAKRLADICFALHIEDTHTVAYALRKLLKQDLLDNEKRGKEIFYSVSEAGRNLCLRYAEVRDTGLQDNALLGEHQALELANSASLLRALSGMYDQAARSATLL